MTLFDLGLTNELSSYLNDNKLSNFSAGRVTQEHRERYVVSTGDNEYDAEITGSLRFSANSRADFPAVGDWVTMTVYDSDQAIIHNILPRKSVLERQAVGKIGEKQIIATNVDVAFIIQAINNNFSINRLERYLTICYSAGIEPVLVISKIDLSAGKDIPDAISNLEKRDKKVKYILLSNMTLKGLDQILEYIQAGKTYCVVGSSGVGKSTLINNLLKRNILKTGPISHSTNKGRHITDHRELFVLENGGIIIDTPGMKELGMTDDAAGIETTFQEIHSLSLKCRFPDCKHINETGCAVIDALNNGVIDIDSYDNYQKIQKEQERFQTTVADKRKKDKVFGKIIKNYYKDKKKNEKQ
ncbi:MAG: ribosome small subunit-dependent GTPase A [Bacteroidetes bacterium GWE2_41_25]|nr:MAG: ribosome small subunit-dependent GTPase A [Bacteroidetes bacterium GWC2_40_22]OFY11623.1 MAG: ribosome small subunit-dependent GTPase A [Bacteroidetes bacterium GWE2_41_25]HCU17805.1 ribosome small subunit-dependent GTPase A [Bacteroidales bacterium]